MPIPQSFPRAAGGRQRLRQDPVPATLNTRPTDGAGDSIRPRETHPVRETPPMSNTTTKHPALASIALAAAVAAGSIWIAGCDKMEASTRQGDRKVEKALVDADKRRDAGGKTATNDTIAALKTAAGITDASPGGQVQAKSELAREE